MYKLSIKKTRISTFFVEKCKIKIKWLEIQLEVENVLSVIHHRHISSAEVMLCQGAKAQWAVEQHLVQSPAPHSSPGCISPRFSVGPSQQQQQHLPG